MSLTKKEKEDLQELIRQEVRAEVQEAMKEVNKEIAALVVEVENFLTDNKI